MHPVDRKMLIRQQRFDLRAAAALLRAFFRPHLAMTTLALRQSFAAIRFTASRRSRRGLDGFAFCGGEGNPLGARALYLGDTLYRIHGTNQPSTILWLLDRPPARAMTHTGTLGGGAAVVGRSQAGDVELHNLKHRLGHQAHPRPIPADPAEASRHSADDRTLLSVSGRLCGARAAPPA